MKQTEPVVRAEKDLMQFLCASITRGNAKICFSGGVPELRKFFRFKPATFLIAGIIFPLLAIMHVQASGVPSSPSEVEVRTGDRRIFVRNRKDDGTLSDSYAYTMKGVNWSPASRGIWPDSDPVGFRQEYFNWYETDIPLMAGMGINTVRLYHDFGTGLEAMDVMDEFYKYGIKVIMPVDSPLHGVVADIANVATVVGYYKDHPAILMWAIGNEWDLNYYYDTFTSLEDAAAFTETAAQLIKTMDTNHPVSTVYGEPHIPQSAYYRYHYIDQDAAPFAPTGSSYFTSIVVNDWVPSVDVWGLNVYRNSSFTDVFSQWTGISDKPMFIGEFGADSYDHNTGSENQTMQSDFNIGLWDEVLFNLASERTNGIASGALGYEWNDEHYKNGNPTTQDISYESNGGQPDGINDEEWFGFVDIDRVPKETVSGLKNRFELDGYIDIPLDGAPTIEALSEGDAATFKINGETMFSRSGGDGGGRGFNVAVLDKETGMRVKEYRHFDTYFQTTPSYHSRLVDYLESLPDGEIIMIAIADEGGLRYRVGWQLTIALLESWGSTEIANVEFRGKWSMIVVKGGSVLAESIEPSASGNIAAAVATPQLTTDAEVGRREPLAPATDFQIIKTTFQNGGYDMDFQSQTGLVYSVEYSNDLVAGDWQTARRGIVAEGDTTSWRDDGSFIADDGIPSPIRFYRIKAIDRVVFD